MPVHTIPETSVDAWQFIEGDTSFPPWMVAAIESGFVTYTAAVLDETASSVWIVLPLGGPLRIEENGWLVKFPDGRIRPFDDDFFAANFPLAS